MSNIDSPNHLDIRLISHRCGTPAHLVCQRNESHMDFSFLLAKNKLNHVLLPCLPLHRGFNFHVDMSDTFLKGRVNKLASFFFYHTERSLAFPSLAVSHSQGNTLKWGRVGMKITGCNLQVTLERYPGAELPSEV